MFSHPAFPLNRPLDVTTGPLPAPPPPSGSGSSLGLEFRKEESSGRGSVFRANRVWRVSSFGRSLVPASAPSLLRWLPLQQVDTDVATCQAFLNQPRPGELRRGRKESGTGSSSVCHPGMCTQLPFALGTWGPLGESWWESAPSGMDTNCTQGEGLVCTLIWGELPRLFKLPQALLLP